MRVVTMASLGKGRALTASHGRLGRKVDADAGRGAMYRVQDAAIATAVET